MERISCRVALLILLGTSTLGFASHDFVPDVPTTIAGSTRQPWTVTHEDGVNFTTLFSLPAGIVIDGLQRLPSDEWLLSLESSADLGGTEFDPRDVILFDGMAGYSLVFDGAAMGVGPDSNLDAILQDTAGNLVVSFDVPTRLDGIDYEPADLIRFDGVTFSLYFDASATTPPIPTTTNVTSADRSGSLTILTFDVPTTLGTATYSPGQLVSWNGVSFALFSQPLAWPGSSQIAALAESVPNPPPPPTGLPSSTGARKYQTLPE